MREGERKEEEERKGREGEEKGEGMRETYRKRTHKISKVQASKVSFKISGEIAIGTVEEEPANSLLLLFTTAEAQNLPA